MYDTALAPAMTASQPVTLREIARQIAAELDAHVSSIYQWLPKENCLELAATYGLNEDLIGQLRLRPDQGLTGLVAETRKPVSIKHPAKHPRYVYVPQSFEERLESYLGVPIFRTGREFIGVLTVQRESAGIFRLPEINAVVQAAHRVAHLLG